MSGDVGETEYALKWPSFGCRLVAVERSEGEVDHGGEERRKKEGYGREAEGRGEILKVFMKDVWWAKWAVRVQRVTGGLRVLMGCFLRLLCGRTLPSQPTTSGPTHTTYLNIRSDPVHNKCQSSANRSTTSSFFGTSLA